MSGFFGNLFGQTKSEEQKKKPEDPKPKLEDQKTQRPAPANLFSGMSLKTAPKSKPVVMSTEMKYSPPTFGTPLQTSVDLKTEKRELPYMIDETGIESFSVNSPISTKRTGVEIQPKSLNGLPNYDKEGGNSRLPSFATKPVIPSGIQPTPWITKPDDFPDEELKMPSKEEPAGISDNDSDRTSQKSQKSLPNFSKPAESPVVVLRKPGSASVKSEQSSEGIREDRNSEQTRIGYQKKTQEAGYKEPPELRKRREEREKAQKELEEQQRLDQERFGSPEKLSLYLQKRLETYSVRNSSMVERQKTLIEEEKSLQDSIFQLRDLEAQTQSEIEEASSREDYEAADQLSERLELLKGKTLECGGAISDKHNEYAELEREKSKLYAEQQNFLAEVVAKSKEIRDKERRELDLLEKAIENYKKTTSDNLEASAIELEVTTDETTKHKEEVESKKALLDAEIVKQTGELENEKAEYETTLASVTDEIRQIEAKLSELKNQQKNLTKKISETNQVIEEKLENFQSQLLELANEQAFIASEFEQLELKKEKLIKEQVTYEAELGNQQSLINTKTKWVDDYQVVITEAEADIHRIEEIVETRQQRLIELEKAELALREKQKSMVEAEEYEREVKNNYELFMQNIVQKEARIREIETRIPGLEAEKKTFASAKLFKDAGRVANEIKACYGEREALDEELKELKRRLPDERQTLEVTEADLRAMRSELDELAQVLEAAKEGLLKSE